MYKVLLLIVTTLSLALSLTAGPIKASDNISWKTPSDSLLRQQYCPMDSIADAMVVQKETIYRINEGNEYTLSIITKMRIKIYTEAGLELACPRLLYHFLS